MPSEKQEPSVVVVGGGVTGTASAYMLAEDHDVTVVDKGMIAGDTTARASGFLATPPTFPKMPDMSEYCMSFFREFDGTGIYTFRECPTVHAVDEDEVDTAETYAERARANDRPVTFRTPAEISSTYEKRFDISSCGGALVFENTGYTNPFDFTVSLKHVAETRGAKFYTDTTVRDIVTADGSVVGVQTRHGRIEADYVLVAAGWRTHDLLADVVEIPVIPARWESVILDPVEEVSSTYPMGTDWVEHGIYWRPTPEGYVLVGGNPIPVDDEEKGERKLSVTDEFLDLVTTEVPGMVQAADDARVVRDECCPTGAAGTPDTMPIIDAPADAPDGLVVAAGFQRGGILAAPATARTVRSLVTGEEPPFSIAPFRLDRFDESERSTDFELVSYVTG